MPPGVNFINNLRTKFSYERRFFTYMHLEKSCQNDVSYKKFVRKLLMKLTAGAYFINILCPSFCTNVFSAAFSSYVFALAKNLYVKCPRLTLMKLTASW
jgi:hypothetical protein